VPAQLTIRDFKGLRIQVESDHGFEEVVRRLHEQTGRTTVGEIGAIAATASSAGDFHKDVTQRFVGSSGFMIFTEFDHGGWISRYGINRRVLRVIDGNPELASAASELDRKLDLLISNITGLGGHESARA